MKRSGGRLRASKADKKWLCSAVTGQSLGCVGLASADDVRSAVRRARSVAPEWAAASAATRQAAAERLTAEIDQRRPEISRLLAEEVGIPVTPLGGYTGYKGVRRTVDRRVAPGVRGVTVAWNDPRAGTPELVVPSLLAGQACVIVVAPEIALSGSVLAEAVRAADLPAGLVTVHAGGVLAVEALHGCGDVAGGRPGVAPPAGARVAGSRFGAVLFPLP